MTQYGGYPQEPLAVWPSTQRADFSPTSPLYLEEDRLINRGLPTASITSSFHCPDLSLPRGPWPWSVCWRVDGPSLSVDGPSPLVDWPWAGNFFLFSFLLFFFSFPLLFTGLFFSFSFPFLFTALFFFLLFYLSFLFPSLFFFFSFPLLFTALFFFFFIYFAFFPYVFLCFSFLFAVILFSFVLLLSNYFSYILSNNRSGHKHLPHVPLNITIQFIVHCSIHKYYLPCTSWPFISVRK